MFAITTCEAGEGEGGAREGVGVGESEGEGEEEEGGGEPKDISDVGSSEAEEGVGEAGRSEEKGGGVSMRAGGEEEISWEVSPLLVPMTRGGGAAPNMEKPPMRRGSRAMGMEADTVGMAGSEVLRASESTCTSLRERGRGAEMRGAEGEGGGRREEVERSYPCENVPHLSCGERGGKSSQWTSLSPRWSSICAHEAVGVAVGREEEGVHLSCGTGLSLVLRPSSGGGGGWLEGA